MRYALLVSALLVSFPLKAEKYIDVLSGIYITDIYDISEKDNTLHVGFWAWWLTASKTFVPAEDIELSNARKVETTHTTSEKIGAMYRTETYYDALIKNAWNLKHYPFDRQTLKIVMEDVLGGPRKLRLAPDIDNIKLAPNMVLAGWEILGITVNTGVSTYHSNFGDPRAESPTSYANISHEIELKRHGWRTYFHFFFSLLLAGFFNVIMFFLPIKDIGHRIGLNLSAVLLVIGTKYIIDAALPAVSYLTLADKLLFCNFLFMILAMISSISNYFLVIKDKLSLGNRRNKIEGAVLISVHYTFFLYFTLESYFS